MRAIVPLMESFLKNTLDSLNKVQTSQILVLEIIPSTLGHCANQDIQFSVFSHHQEALKRRQIWLTNEV